MPVVHSQSRKRLRTLRSIRTVFKSAESDVELPLQVGFHLSLLLVDLVMGGPLGGPTWVGVVERELRSDCERGYEEAVLQIGRAHV